MREIKFRIWDHTQNQWLGDHITDGFILYDIKKPSKELVAMQYTGLKDKNGKEVYEGDIIKNDQCIPKYMKIIFERGCFHIEVQADYFFRIELLAESELVGNIFENKDLINEQE